MFMNFFQGLCKLIWGGGVQISIEENCGLIIVRSRGVNVRGFRGLTWINLLPHERLTK